MHGLRQSSVKVHLSAFLRSHKLITVATQNVTIHRDKCCRQIIQVHLSKSVTLPAKMTKYCTLIIIITRDLYTIQISKQEYCNLICSYYIKHNIISNANGKNGKINYFILLAKFYPQEVMSVQQKFAKLLIYYSSLYTLKKVMKGLAKNLGLPS